MKFVRKSWFLNTLILASLLIFGGITSTISQKKPNTSLSQFQREQIIEAQVLEVISQEEVLFGENPSIIQTLKTEITSGSNKGEVIDTIVNRTNTHSPVLANVNDTLLLGLLEDDSGKYYYLIDFMRLKPVAWLLGTLLLLTILVLRRNSLNVLLALAISFYVVLQFIVPFIADGYDPVMISLIGLSIIIPSSFYLVHGYSSKTTIAILGTVLSLTMVTALSWFTIEAAKLTAIVREDVFTIFALNGQLLSLRGMLMAGILISVLGILDDVTITQASIVQQLKKKGQSSPAQLYAQAMKVGRDHIASAVNTLILVYAGAALPTLILLTQFPRPLMVTLNDEAIILEVVLALIGTIALIIAIPITTALSVHWGKVFKK